MIRSYGLIVNRRKPGRIPRLAGSVRAVFKPTRSLTYNPSMGGGPEYVDVHGGVSFYQMVREKLPGDDTRFLADCDFVYVYRKPLKRHTLETTRYIYRQIGYGVTP